MRMYGDRALLDFGFIGTDRRFEATSRSKNSECEGFSPVANNMLDWLQSQKPSSFGILRVSKWPAPRDLRLNGFVPCRTSLFVEAALSEVWCLLEGQSVVLLHCGSSAAHLPLALLKARCCQVREIFAVWVRPKTDTIVRRIANAAEGRPAYGPSRTTNLRAGGLLDDAQRLLAVGRHAGAERGLRAGIGAFDRRGDGLHAGEAEMILGRLLLSRGRAIEAARIFERAHDRFQRVRAAVPAVDAMTQLGVAQTDLGLLCDAERSCRAARSAAAALKMPNLVASAGIALARGLIWLEQRSEARSVLETLVPNGDAEIAARYWCLVARLHIAGNNVVGAGHAIGRARPSADARTPSIESLVRRWEAVVQARVGDLEAFERHVQIGLAAARAARLPLRSLKLRLTLIDGLVDAEKIGRARAEAAHVRGISRAALPPLLKQRVERTLALVEKSASRPNEHQPDRVREATPDFHSDRSVEDVDGLRDLLSLSHQFEDEAEALTRAATAVRRHTHAVSVGFYGCSAGEARLFGASGAPSQVLARRSFDAGLTIEPEASANGVEGAVPIRYLGRFVGALAIRWTVEGPEQTQRAMAFCSAAAAACAPLVYVLLERQRTPVPTDTTPDLLGVSGAMDEVRRAIGRAANAPFTVLIEGESGSGKELVARAIHQAGKRRERRFCAFNCAAMPEDLVDAELFGHAKGAFTGAATERLGLFESADGGTVFLDEVAELSARAQAKVLRALQEGEVRRLGENFTRSFDARLLAATNRSLRADVEAGRFRQDLLYRLDVIRIVVPPLRDRVEDIPLLAARFWRQSAERIGSRAVLSQSVLSALARYDWPGNVRELQNVLTALVVTTPSRGVVSVSALPAAIVRGAPPSPQESLETARLRFEERFVRAALARAAGHRGQTAAALGLSRQGLAKLMQRLHLDA
jgi:DNA-binding NtrC family response regulator